jgi:hypothetical protein
LSYPELYSDERVVLQAQNVKVKSVVFEVVLTTRRLVLIDTKKNSIPPQEINLATLKDVESGENAIRDPTLTISIITISGNTRQMVLTFSKISGGERRRECDEWVRALRQNVTSTVYHPVGQVPAPIETDTAPPVQSPVVQPPEGQPPAQASHRIDITNTPPPKKRIEIARPMKKIVEAAPAMPVPVETSSLPTGSFCNRCGNRVPPESAFCNRCGTPVVRDTDFASQPFEGIAAPPQQPVPAVPQIQDTSSPVFPSVTDMKDSSIEEVIHSIEPLIEDSVPRTAPGPLVPTKQHYAPPADMAVPSDQTPQAVDTDAPGTTAQPGDVQWPVLSKSGMQDTVPAAPPVPGSLPPLPPPRKIPFKLIAVIAFVVLAVIAGAYVFTQGQAGTPGVTPTTEITVPQTTVPHTTVPQTTVATAVKTTKPTVTVQLVTTPAAQVPASGVWVEVTYSGKYTGQVGTSGRLRDITENGGPFYQIYTSEGPVVVSIQKSDGSAAVLAVDVYKDGTLMKHDATSAPKGFVEFEATIKDVAATTDTITATTTEETTPASG